MEISLSHRRFFKGSKEEISGFPNLCTRPLHPMRSLTSLYYKAVFSEHKGSQNIYLKINETK
jgi:hypothetical protein